MQNGQVVDVGKSVFFEIRSTGPDEREYNPLPRFVDGSRVMGVSTGSNRGRPPAFVGHSVKAKEEMVARYRAGEGLTALAAAFSTSVNRVREILKLAGVEIRPSGYFRREAVNSVPENDEVAVDSAAAPVEDAAAKEKDVKGSKKSLTIDEERAIVQRYELGEGVKSLSVEFGIGAQRVKELVKEYGGKVRGRKKPVTASGGEFPLWALSPEPAAEFPRLATALADLPPQPSANGVAVSSGGLEQLRSLAELLRDLKDVPGARVAGSVVVSLQVEIEL